MKSIIKFLIIIIISLSINSIVYAKDILELKEPVIQFNKPKRYGLQGYTVVKDKLFIVLEGHGDTRSIIKVFDLNTYKEIISYDYGSLGHANDVTYNSKNNKIYILAGGGSDKLFIFNGDTFKYEKSINIGLPVRSITYVDKYDKYAVRTVSVGFIYNSDFSLYSKFPFVAGMSFNSEVGRQGWTYYNDYIYYANWSWVSAGGDGTNIIFIYNLDGDRFDSLYTDDTVGEIEGVDFYNNKMILGFNGYDSTIKFYIHDIPEVIPLPDEEEIVEAPIVEKKNYTIYIFLGIGLLIVLIIVIVIILGKNKKAK